MKVTVDLTMVDRFFAYLKTGQFEDVNLFKTLMEELSELESFQKMLRFYEAVFNQETYAEILYLALNDMAYVSEDQSLTILHKNLSRLRNIELVSRKLDLIRSYHFEVITSKLEESLPEKNELEVNIVFLFDGINGGSILGEHDLLLNVMLWPSDIKNLHLIEGILLHEFHHVGLKNQLINETYMVEENLCNRDISKYLLTAIMSEGIATYLFNNGHDLYPLVAESHGAQYADLYRQSMCSRSLQIPDLIETFQEDVKELLSQEREHERNLSLISKYCYNTDGTEPRDKAIGYQMCQAIDTAYGRVRLIECLKSPIDFLRVYSRIEGLDFSLKFSDEFIDQYGRIFEERSL